MELESQLGPQSRHIRSSIQTRSKEAEGYSHPHTTPQWIFMGNHRMEHYQSHVNTFPPIVLEVTIVETWKQHDGVKVIQSRGACIIIRRVETGVVPNINVV
jgi:hypothetical protein